jgi:aspartate ammonia-lyase
MDHRLALAGVLVVTGALVGVEVLGENKAHGDYNVPAPTVTVNANQATNATATMVSFDLNLMDYQTAATNLILVVKG